MAQVKEAVRAGPLLFAPLNRNAMFTDYVDPAERAVACPNQDVVYGLASIALDLSPVVAPGIYPTEINSRSHKDVPREGGRLMTR